MTANGHLNLFLQDLDERKGRIPFCQEVSLIQSRVRRVIRSILLEVRRENPFFRTTLINSGSFYEGTKVGQPDEFDFLIQLDSFSGPEINYLHELPCSTVVVLPVDKSIREDLWFFFPHSRKLRNGYFEWKETIKTPFYEIFNKKAKDFEAFGMKVVLDDDSYVSTSLPLSRHGPAYTLLLEWNGGERYKGLRISVDLVLAVRINNRPDSIDVEFETPTGMVLRSLVDKLPFYYAVGAYKNTLTEVQPNFFDNWDTTLPLKNFCLRCSLSCLEQELFRHTFGFDSGQAKCLRLLKILRDIVFPDDSEFKVSSDDSDFWFFHVNIAVASVKKIGRLLSSYVLKTLVLFEWQLNPEKEQWSGNNLSQRFLNILRRLVDHLKERKMRSFFYADYNIFPSSVTKEMDFLNVASIITILLDGLSFVDNMNVYNFEGCLTKLKEDFIDIIYRKKTLTALLLIGVWDTFFRDSSVDEVVQESLTKGGKAIAFQDSDAFAAAGRAIAGIKEKISLLNIYVQAFLDSVAPNESLILTDVNVKDTTSLSQAGQQFEEIARRRMETSANDLPSYSLWSQEHWRLEGSSYKYKTDELRKLLEFLISAFREDIAILHNEMKDW